MFGDSIPPSTPAALICESPLCNLRFPKKTFQEESAASDIGAILLRNASLEIVSHNHRAEMHPGTEILFFFGNQSGRISSDLMFSLKYVQICNCE